MAISMFTCLIIIKPTMPKCIIVKNENGKYIKVEISWKDNTVLMQQYDSAICLLHYIYTVYASHTHTAWVPNFTCL